MSKSSLLIFISIFGIAASTNAQHSHLRIVAWNIEHLAEHDGEGCVARNASDYNALREFAATINADVVALQEVENEAAVARVFPTDVWEIVLSKRPDSEPYICRGSGRTSTQQKVAYAIRKGVSHENLGSFEELTLNNPDLRHGLMLRLTDAPSPIDVLNVHMKSGCFVNNYASSTKNACETFEQQAPVLDGWMEERIQKNIGFIVLGDFNHRILEEGNRLWADLTTMHNAPVPLRSSMENIRGCHPRYPAPIDHVLVGSVALNYYKEGSGQVFYFTDETMTEDDMLSDHCDVV